MVIVRLIVLLSLLLASGLAADPAATGDEAAAETVAAESTEDEKERTLPFFSEWFDAQDIPLPLPLGAGLMAIFVERDIEVDDVTVQFLDRPPESISDRADFEISNRTRSLAARFDAWVLPFINVYALAGQATTETSLRSRIVIERPIAPPLEVENSDDSTVDVTMMGFGMTAVIGGDAWFAMADVNYTFAELDLFD